jgi:hypothetical protein
MFSKSERPDSLIISARTLFANEAGVSSACGHCMGSILTCTFEDGRLIIYAK